MCNKRFYLVPDKYIYSYLTDGHYFTVNMRFIEFWAICPIRWAICPIDRGESTSPEHYSQSIFVI